jgi:hypothetical protein
MQALGGAMLGVGLFVLIVCVVALVGYWRDW